MPLGKSLPWLPVNPGRDYDGYIEFDLPDTIHVSSSVGKDWPFKCGKERLHSEDRIPLSCTHSLMHVFGNYQKRE